MPINYLLWKKYQNKYLLDSEAVKNKTKKNMTNIRILLEYCSV